MREGGRWYAEGSAVNDVVLLLCVFGETRDKRRGVVWQGIIGKGIVLDSWREKPAPAPVLVLVAVG